MSNPPTAGTTPPAEAVHEERDQSAEVSPWLARLDMLVGFLVLLALVVHPTQISVHHWVRLALGSRLAGLVPQQNVTVADGLLLVAFGLWVVRVIWQGRVRERLGAYPLALVFFFAAAVLSAVLAFAGSGGSEALKNGLKELVQLGILFVCGFCVLADYLEDPAWRRRLVLGFVATSMVALAWGLVEYSRLRPGQTAAAEPGYTVSPAEVDGPFGLRRGQQTAEKGKIPTASNRNVLGSWVTLIVPFLAAIALWGRRHWVRVLCAVAALAGLPLLLTGGLWAAGLLALLILAFLRSRWAFLGAAVAAGILFMLLPSWHGDVLLDSVMLRRSVDRFYVLRLYGDDATAYAAGGGQRRSLNYGAWAEPKELSKWQQKWVEWQPGLKAVADQPLTGAGVGMYQPTIGRYYGGPELTETIDPDRAYELAKPPVNLMEFGANSFYLVWAVTTGFLGLLGLLWMLLAALRRAGLAAWRTAGPERALALGAAGALVAASFGMFFAEYLVRGVGVAFVFALALCVALERCSRAEKAADIESRSGGD